MAAKTKSTNSTDIKKKHFIDLYFKKTGNISELCKAINIHRTTYYLWMKKDPKFADAIKDQSEGLIDFAESKLLSMINDKNTAAVIFFLKTKGKSRGYIEQTDFRHSGGIQTNGTLKIEIRHVKLNGDPVKKLDLSKMIDIGKEQAK